MNNIYYITRSYTHTSFSGGAIMREGAVNLLRQRGFNVIVVTVAASLDSEVFSDDFISIYPGRIPEKIRRNLQRINLLPDYLASWANKAAKYLIGHVRSNDIIFCSTGGDLASLMVGSAVKDEVGSKFIANFRDPVSYTSYYGERLGKYTNFSRNKVFSKYLDNVDVIVTSCNSYKAYLDTWTGSKVVTNHFGYIDSTVIPCDFSKRKEKKLLTAFYGGTLEKYQNPGLVSNFFSSCKGVSLDVYGHSGSKIKIKSNISFYNSIPREQFLEKVVDSYDFGFVSLGYDYFGACIPSKIYEYINLGVPIFGFLPRGEARDIVNDNNFGYVALPNSINDLKNKLQYISSNQSELLIINENILRSRKSWSMSSKIDGLIEILNEV
ncbi:hypothetical protein [Motiliproteus coralliicola]|uniref:hypothetical protein n=1 Tax=Motiliproteus coralliicola TaxID=2283196 RepID=UPI001058BC50|nr:hypothetical protein [Motiliproteus coralliicola]